MDRLAVFGRTCHAMAKAISLIKHKQWIQVSLCFALPFPCSTIQVVLTGLIHLAYCVLWRYTKIKRPSWASHHHSQTVRPATLTSWATPVRQSGLHSIALLGQGRCWFVGVALFNHLFRFCRAAGVSADLACHLQREMCHVGVAEQALAGARRA